MSKRQRVTPTEDQLREFSEHLLYEVEMLGEACSMLGSHHSTLGSQLPRVVENALLESWAVHARSLVEFFFREPTDRGVRPDDALASDYFAPAVWRSLRKEIPEILEPVRGRAGQEIAHLSYKRINLSEEARRWSYGSVTSELSDLAAVFVHRCPPHQVAADFRDRVWSAIPGFARVKVGGRDAIGHPPDWWPPPARPLPVAAAGATQGLRS